ncbi:MAG: hypothetical protein NXI22_03345 [bacterium]|nr:hypothetical protein [bacterium]
MTASVVYFAPFARGDIVARFGSDDEIFKAISDEHCRAHDGGGSD